MPTRKAAYLDPDASVQLTPVDLGTDVIGALPASSVEGLFTWAHTRSDATSAPQTVTLPAATGSGTIRTVKKIDASANTVTVQRAGADLIDGVATYVLTVQYQSVTVLDAATGVWDIV